MTVLAQGNYVVKKHVDSWLAVCERCPLPDCVRTEGAIGAPSTFVGCGPDHPIYQCPVYRAQFKGWDTDEALQRADELGLLEPVEWLEL